MFLYLFPRILYFVSISGKEYENKCAIFILEAFVWFCPADFSSEIFENNYTWVRYLSHMVCAHGPKIHCTQSHDHVKNCNKLIAVSKTPKRVWLRVHNTRAQNFDRVGCCSRLRCILIEKNKPWAMSVSWNTAVMVFAKKINPRVFKMAFIQWCLVQLL